MSTRRYCGSCGKETPHEQVAPADVPGDTYSCLLCPIRTEVEAAVGGSDE